jgi:outer membrane protein W
MKKLFFFFITVFLLIGTNHAQMNYAPIDLKINTPDDAVVYKKYMKDKTFLGLTTGISIPFGNYSENINVGLGLGLQAKYFISDNFVFGASFNFYRSGLKDAYLKSLDTIFTYISFEDTTGLQVLSVDGASTLYPFTLNLEYYFSPMKRFKPYVGLGLGFCVINHNIEISTNKDKPQYFRDLETEFAGSSLTSNFAVTPYFGCMIDFNELVSINFDLKYNQIFSNPVASSLTFNAGIMFNLGYKY